jgi:hypothetical protein
MHEEKENWRLKKQGNWAILCSLQKKRKKLIAKCWFAFLYKFLLAVLKIENQCL